MSNNNPEPVMLAGDSWPAGVAGSAFYEAPPSGIHAKTRLFLE